MTYLEKRDDLTEMTLTALFKRSRCGTSQLKNMTGGKSRSIRYRIDEYLIPAGLVKEVGRKSHAGNDERVFQLTEKGHKWVSREWEELAHYAQRQEILDASRERKDEIDRLHLRIDDIEDEVGKKMERWNQDARQLRDDFRDHKKRTQGDVGQLRSRIEEIENKIEKMERDIQFRADRAQQNQDDIAKLEEKVERIEEKLKDSLAIIYWMASQMDFKYEHPVNWTRETIDTIRDSFNPSIFKH